MPIEPDSAASRPPLTAVRPGLPFHQHFREVSQGLRGALTDLFTSIGLDPTRPRELVRQLKLDKNVVWRASRIITAHDESAAAHHVPGPAAVRALLASVKKAGAPDSAIERVRHAFAAFDEMVVVHMGDRATLEQVAAGMTSHPEMAERQEASRRQAFMGLSGTWGVKAEVQLATFIIAPSADDSSTIDLIQFGGLLGFRRLRADVRWVIFRRYLRSDDGSGMPAPAGEALDPRHASDALPLLSGFCTDDLPEFELHDHGDETRWILPPGPVGNTGAFTSMFGLIHRNLPAKKTLSEQAVEFTSTLSTPVERLQFDLIVSDELPWLHHAKPELFSRLNGDGVTASDPREVNRVPMLERVQDLGGGHPSMASPHVPRYTEMLDLAFERAGWDSSGFHGFRLGMRYPPIPTSLILGADLPDPT